MEQTIGYFPFLKPKGEVDVILNELEFGCFLNNKNQILRFEFAEVMLPGINPNK